jgi:hypothetical protein
VAGCGECGDEASGSCATELVLALRKKFSLPKLALRLPRLQITPKISDPS